MDVEMTVDSGADLSMIPYQVGLGLGLARSRVTLRELSGVAGGLRYDLHRLCLRLGPFDFRARVACRGRDRMHGAPRLDRRWEFDDVEIGLKA